MPDTSPVTLIALTQRQIETLNELIERDRVRLKFAFDATEWRDLESLRQAIEGE